MFKICRYSGFHMTFENGYTISVQFGGGTYCKNYDAFRGIDYKDSKDSEKIIEDINYKLRRDGCIDAEIAIIGPQKELLEFPDGEGTVKGYLSADEVLKWMNYAASLPKESKDD